MRYIQNKIKELKQKISLVDRCLLVYLSFLLVYISIHLFTGAQLQDTNAIDVVVRTSTAVIIGYFLSGNFIKSNSVGNQSNINTVSKQEMKVDGSETETVTKNQIGFQVPSEEGKLQNGFIQMEQKSDGNESGKCNSIQVMIVAGIGGISLILLFAVRNYLDTNPEITATVSQFRDFVSACVGFLVSCGKSEK